jgi:hypothetical protein
MLHSSMVNVVNIALCICCSLLPLSIVVIDNSSINANPALYEGSSRTMLAALPKNCEC